jgi:DNA-binding NarL/FixJ family response regulator
VLGIRSVIAFPALGKHRPVAVLAVYTRDRREPAESLLRTLATVGEAIGRFVNQTRLDPPARRLTAREIEVLELSAAGLRGPAIAERLYVSPTTVKTHFEHIYEKLGVSDRAAAVAYAFRTGVIS